MNKRGQYDLGRKSIYLLIVIFFLAIMFIYLNVSFSKFDARVLEASKTIAGKVLLEEVVYSPHCFAYVDVEVGRAYPGIIDVYKLNNKTIYSTCGKYYKDQFAVYVFPSKYIKNYIKDFTFQSQVRSWGLNNSDVYKIGSASYKFEKYFARPIILDNQGKRERGVIVVGYD